jgi:hypothetical protein
VLPLAFPKPEATDSAQRSRAIPDERFDDASTTKKRHQTPAYDVATLRV